MTNYAMAIFINSSLTLRLFSSYTPSIISVLSSAFGNLSGALLKGFGCDSDLTPWSRTGIIWAYLQH